MNAYEYDSYSKMELDVDNISEKFKKKKVMKQIQGAIDKLEKNGRRRWKGGYPNVYFQKQYQSIIIESPRKKR